MCKDAGLSVRFISGYAPGAHAWNIVKIGDEYYNLDCTWDGQDAESYHDYFLKSKDDFAFHYRESAYDTEDFHTQYPMAETSWEDYSQLTSATGMNLENVSEFDYCNIEGETINNYANEKPKILVFGSIGCYNSQCTISGLSEGSFDDIDVIFIDAIASDMSSVSEFRNTYGSTDDDIVYTYNTKGTNIGAYISKTDASSVTFPFIVYIDSDNMIQYQEYGGGISGNDIREHANVYVCGEDLAALSSSSVTINKGYTYQLDICVYGVKRNAQFFTWSSSNTSVATVDANGKVTGKAAGKAKIICKINDKISVSCDVVVKEAKNGLQKASDGKWYYYTNNKVDTSYTGLAKNEYGWWYVKNGKLDTSYTGLGKNEYGWWYVKNGKLDTSYTGLGKNAYGWWYVTKGKLDMTYTGIASNAYGQWYMKNGKLDTSYTGKVTYNGVTYNIKNGKVV